MVQKYKQAVERILKGIDVKINGSRPWDIKILNEKFYARLLSGGSLALGESYMEGWWTCKSIDKLVERFVRANLETSNIKLRHVAIPYLKAKLLNMQKTKAYHIGDWHYDTGNELYKAMLDKNMNYSCGYWKNAKTLDQAQINKMEMICKKLKLKKGETLLDIGCGWAGLAKYAAKNYGVKVVGITVSKEQAKLARDNCKGLPVEIRVIDYRKIKEKFDKIVSVGMIEHVGFKNYRTYMQVAHRCLKPKGIFLLHTIGSKTSTTAPGDPWVDKYIFPNGKLPSIAQLAKASEKLFSIEDIHSFGHDYARTLLAWNENFQKAWPTLKKDYDERFYRMWTYYLLLFVGTFNADLNQLWQIVLVKGKDDVYHSVRP